MKKIVIGIILSVAIGTLTNVGAVHAQDDKPCFKSGSGIQFMGEAFESAECSPTDLIEFMNSLNRFFYRLAIVLAVLMITVGGMQWLVGMGNSGKIGNAKDTIQQAILGLLLALVAVLLFNQIDTRFTNLKIGPLQLTEQEVNCTTLKNPTTCELQKYCAWICKDAKEQAKPRIPATGIPQGGKPMDYQDPFCDGTCGGRGDGKTKDGGCINLPVADCQSSDGCYIDGEYCASSPATCMDTLAEYQAFRQKFPTLNPKCCSLTKGQDQTFAWANVVFNKAGHCESVCGDNVESNGYWVTEPASKCEANVR